MNIYDLEARCLKQLPWVAVDHQATDQFIRHCRDNFMSALKGLKLASQSMSCQCSQVDMCGHESDCSTGRVLKLIAQLEQVKP